MNQSGDNFKKKGAHDIIAQMEKMAAIGDLAAGIAHELNTPLATISIISQELKDIAKKNISSKAFQKEIQGYLNDIETETNRCAAIIKDVQDFAKKGIHKKKSISITDIILKTVDFVSKGKSYKGVVIRQNLAIFPQVFTDPDKFRQVLLNILKNAIQAVGEAKRKREIIVSIKREKQSVIITVQDTGKGIFKKDFKRLFEPFFTTKPAGKGTGLGLFVSYGIMKDLGGDIKIDSKRGKGTSVHLSLPIE